MGSTLISRNITVNGHRTSVRLESTMWQALDEVCKARRQTLHDFCSEVAKGRQESSLTAAIRVAILQHYRSEVSRLGNPAGDSSQAHLNGY